MNTIVASFVDFVDSPEDLSILGVALLLFTHNLARTSFMLISCLLIPLSVFLKSGSFTTSGAASRYRTSVAVCFARLCPL